MPYQDDERAPTMWDSQEMLLTAEEVILSDHPEIMGDVVYQVDFKATGSQREFDVEITDVTVKDIKNPVYDEEGNQMILREDEKQKFAPRAYSYFWKKLVNQAEEKAMDRMQWGSR